jgi:hypothetical protein
MYDRPDLIWDGNQLRLLSNLGVVLATNELDQAWPGMWRVRLPDGHLAGPRRSRFARAWRSEPAPGGCMSGRRSRRKGVRTERCIVSTLKASGIAAVRVPLSGAVGGRFAGDIVLPLMGRDLCVEVKARADGFRELYCWLDGRDMLIVKAERQEPLVVVRLSLAAETAKLGSAAPCFGKENGAPR